MKEKKRSVKPFFTQYRGRFAPSPSGELHFGSLLAAMASYADARSQNGLWLLRIDDIDQQRVIPHSDQHIVQSLEQIGFQWDGEISYQSQCISNYEEALEKLIQMGLVYPCHCSRKQIKVLSHDGVYSGTCRHRIIKKNFFHHSLDKNSALRLKVNSDKLFFSDEIQQNCQQNLAREVGDFVIFRRDQVFSYQLSVVVDDYISQISHIIRGFDLLDSTARQIYLQQQLGYPTPKYAHIPLAVNEKQIKLSKLSQAKKIKSNLSTLISAAQFLGQSIMTDKDYDKIEDFWQHLFLIWDINKISKMEKKEIMV
ncbi:MAG: tRNA glutamyl-Q(34) synthetase GluQRS [gamma proteobacterium symbiont of Taylorina sp.]|nr:tRNA glutamyl-Q(34) synthetase GluQRS [gamma proteobacterium symbiont of Taylorina sp.]